MDTPNVSLPGYRIHEYRLVIELPQVLQERISHLRSKLFERHRVKPGSEGRPALPLMHCHAFEKTEARLVERLQQLALSGSPFKIELQNFSAYPSHTIYINVPTRTPFQDLSGELKKLKWLMNIPGQDPQFISEPQLILAQRLKPMQFIGMWMECEHSEFSGRFIATHLTLLRRAGGEGPWETTGRFELLQMPSAVKQGELFA